MSSSGIRLRISLLVAIASVLANMYLVLNGSSNGFYAGLSKGLVLDTPQATTQVAQKAKPVTQSRYSFAAFVTRAKQYSNVD